MRDILAILLMAFALTFVGCGKKEGCTNILATNYDSEAEEDDGSCILPAVVTTGTTETETNSNFYFKATIDGVTISLKVGEDGYNHNAGYGSSINGSDEFLDQSFGLSAGSGKVVGAASILKRFPTGLSSCDEIDAMFKVGSYSYGNTSNKIDGAEVYYVDGNEVRWTTNLVGDPTDQTGSKFEITEHIQGGNDVAEATTTAKFNCTLYDGSGNSKVLTGGELRSGSVSCGFY